MQNDMRDRLTASIENAKKLYEGDVTDLTETEYVAECLLSEGVVPVVRCKNCIYANDYGTICRYGVGREVKPEHYCSYGERKITDD